MAQEVVISSVIQIRRDTTDNWRESSLILKEGELAYDRTANILKVGDGSSPFEELPVPVGGLDSVLDQRIQTLETGKAEKADVYTKTEADEKTEALQSGKADRTEVYTKAEADAKVETLVPKKLTGSKGTALIFNEADGGGAKFEHPDGLASFVGVNDGAEGSPLAQIYADRLTDGKYVGTRINVYEDKIYYHSKATRQQPEVPANDASEYELAVQKDVQAVDTKLSALSEACCKKAELSGQVGPMIQAALTEKLTDGVLFHYKGSAENAEALESKKQDAKLGDVYQVGETEGPKELYIYDGDTFDSLGAAGRISLDGYLKGTDLPQTVLAGAVTATPEAEKIVLSVNGYGTGDGSFSNPAPQTAELPKVGESTAGLMLPADKKKLDSLDGSVRTLEQTVSTMGETVRTTGETVTELQSTTGTHGTKLTELEKAKEEHGTKLTELGNTIEEHGTQLTKLEGTVGEHKTKLAGLEKTTGEQGTKLDTLQSTVEGHTSQLGTLQDTTQGHTSQLTTLQSTTGEHTATLTTLESTTQGHTTQLTKLESTVEGHKAQLTALETSSGEHDTKLAELEGTTKGHTSQLGTLESTTQGHTDRLTAAEKKQTELEGKQTEQGTDIQSMKEQLKKLETRIEELAGAVVNKRVVDGIVALGIQIVNQKISESAESHEKPYAVLTCKLSDDETGTGEVTVTIAEEKKTTEVHNVFTDIGAWVLRVLVDNADRLTTVQVEGKDESKIVLPKDRRVEGIQLKEFVKASGLLEGGDLTGKTQLSALDNKSLTVVITDMNEKTYKYRLQFKVASSEAA